MIYLAQARYLLLILVIPVLYISYGAYLKVRRRRIEKFGDVKLVSKLMPEASTGKGWFKITLLALAWLFFAIGLARPQLGARLKERESQGAEVMIALDVSNSMLAEDFSPNRLERSKLAISRVVDKLQGDRVGLIVFAGQAFVQLPITTDYVSAKVFLNTINTSSVPVQGTAIGEALTFAARSFSTQSDKSRAIVLITDGEDHEGNVLEVAQSIAEEGIRIYCIGIGTPAGKPIPIGGDLMKDKDGQIVVTKLDEGILQEIASVGNGKYVRAGNGEFGLNPIIDDIKQMEDEQFQSVVFEDFDEQYMYFFAVALFFLLLELLVSDRKGKQLFVKREENK